MRIFIFCIVLLFFVFLYLLNSLLPHLSVAEVLSSFANCWYGSLLFANCRNKLFFKWSHQINFFVFQIVAAPDRMYLQVIVRTTSCYRRPKLTFHLFWSSWKYGLCCADDVYVHEDMSAVREGQEGYIGPHIMWQETHESHHQVNTKHGIDRAHSPIQNR